MRGAPDPAHEQEVTLDQVAVPVVIGRAAPRSGTRSWLIGLLTPRCIVVALVSVLLALFSVAVVLATPDVPLPTMNLVMRPYLVLAPAIIGLIWCRRRPESRTGRLLIAVGWLTAGCVLELTRIPALAQIGIGFGAAVAVVQTYLVVTFPVGRLRSRAEKVAVGSLLLAIGVSLALMPFNPVVRPVDYLAACGDACPPNPMYQGPLGIPGGGTLMRDWVVCVIGILVTIPVVLVYIDRWRHGSRRQRAAILPLACTSLLLFPARALHQAVGLANGMPPDAFTDDTWLLVAARVIFPLGFLLALLSAEFLASRTASELMGRLAMDRDRGRWASTIARSLDDPTLQVGFWNPAHAAYLQADGTPLVRPAGGERAWIEVTADRPDATRPAGRPLAAVAGDPSLTDDPELLGAVAAATRIAAETGELMEDLRASRARLVDAADQERQRLGRDLHDSAQQRLVAIRVRLALARDRIGPAAGDAGIAELERELDAALEELRSVAQGLYPVHLERDGLAVALRSVTRSWPLPISVTEACGARFPAAWESAAYFVCLEALQNVVKHAGPDAAVKVVIEHHEGAMGFTVSDTGCGFDPGGTPDGAGLQNMRDRMAAIGGRLSVTSAPGAGTVVHGTAGA